MITLFWTVAFCLGWRIITDKNNILYFIRKPFEGLEDELENKKSHYVNFHPDSFQILNYYLLQLILLIATPVILCITCMASVWGFSVFYVLNGINLHLLPYLILNCVSASFIQTFIWSIYVKYFQ